MNLFGFEIAVKKNNKYVKKEDCHQAMNSIHHRIGEVKDFLNQRITDTCDKIDIVTNLLKDK